MTCKHTRTNKSLWVAVVVISFIHSMAAAQPISQHPENPHYLLFRGKPTVLVSSAEHYGAAINLDFDYIRYLNELASKGNNYTRIFAGPMIEPWGDDHNTLNPAYGRLIVPWARSSTPGYIDGGNKFDLNQWDTAFFTRLKHLIQEAGNRDIVVEITLTGQYYNDENWQNSPLHCNNNINGVGCTGNTGSDVIGQIERMTRKYVQELQDFDNVFFEIANEERPAWSADCINWIQQEEQHLPFKHLIAENVEWYPFPTYHDQTALPGVSIMNFHYGLPEAVYNNYNDNNIISIDETGFNGTGDTYYRKEAWNFMIAGGGIYNNLDWSFAVGHENGTYINFPSHLGGGSPSLRTQCGILKRFMDSFEFIRMSPNNSVIVGGVPNVARALVDVGQQYAIYLDGGSQANLTIDLPEGIYMADWINTKNENIDKTETFTHGGGHRTLVSPYYAEDIAMRIITRSIEPPRITSVTAVSNSQIRITWQDLSDNEDTFIVQRSPWQGRNDWHTIATLPADTTSCVDTDSLHGLTIYNYRVGASQ